MRTVFFVPPLSRMSGGLNSINELADILYRQGHAVAVTSPAEIFPGLAEFNPGITRIAWSDIMEQARNRPSEPLLSPDDIWCVPESWPNSLAPGIALGAHPLVYAQSWVYLLSTLPPGVSWRQLQLKYLAVSAPVEWFLREIFDLEVSGVLPPAVSGEFFAAPLKIKRDGRIDEKRVRVAWMPRKNKALAGQIQQIAVSALGREGLDTSVEFIEIDGLSKQVVAEIFAMSDIFLSTGFPEGFGLPPLEAMACGCVPVGFSGLGGFDYMRCPEPAQGCGFRFSQPHFPLVEREWGANSLIVPDGDVLGAGLALAWAVKQILTGNGDWNVLRQNAVQAASAYSLERREAAVADLWPRLIAGFRR